MFRNIKTEPNLFKADNIAKDNSLDKPRYRFKYLYEGNAVFFENTSVYYYSNQSDIIIIFCYQLSFKLGSLLTTGIYCDGYFIDCDVHHSLNASYRLFRKKAKGIILLIKKSHCYDIVIIKFIYLGLICFV